MRWFLALFPIAAFTLAADPPKPAPAPVPLKITPGKVIIPFDKMRRIWGELVSIDPKTRTGTFRNESNDEIMPFIVMPYAELLHHAARGDLQDFRIGERAICRLHENAEGKWVYLTYIQDEMNFQNGHKEYYIVDAIDAKEKSISFTQATANKSFVRQTGLVLETDENTRYWKATKPATFADIKIGDLLLAKTHGRGKGKHRVCWELFLDDESRNVFQTEQLAVHRKRMQTEGLPGYVDAVDKGSLTLTIFPEAGESAKPLKAGQAITLAPAGVDRKPTTEPIAGTITKIQAGKGNTYEATVSTTADTGKFQPTELFRLWITTK